jgi:hypothetical protein
MLVGHDPGDKPNFLKGCFSLRLMTTLHWVYIDIIALSVDTQEVLLLIQRNNQFILVDTAMWQTGGWSERSVASSSFAVGDRMRTDQFYLDDASARRGGSLAFFYDGLISAGPVSNFGLQDGEIFQ